MEKIDVKKITESVQYLTSRYIESIMDLIAESVQFSCGWFFDKYPDSTLNITNKSSGDRLEIEIFEDIYASINSSGYISKKDEEKLIGEIRSLLEDASSGSSEWLDSFSVSTRICHSSRNTKVELNK